MTTGTIMRKPERPPDLEVELRLFSTEEGGLAHSLPQGCRLPNDFGLEGEMNHGMYIFKGDPPDPGETRLAELWLLIPERSAGRLQAGSKFYPWHMRSIGEGIVRKVINPVLRLDA
jgi:hypothetical protein